MVRDGRGIDRRWIRAEQVRAGFVVQTPDPRKPCIEVERVERLTDRVLLHGWVTYAATTKEEKVTGAAHSFRSALWLLDDLSRVKGSGGSVLAPSHRDTLVAAADCRAARAIEIGREVRAAERQVSFELSRDSYVITGRRRRELEADIQRAQRDRDDLDDDYRALLRALEPRIAELVEATVWKPPPSTEKADADYL